MAPFAFWAFIALIFVVVHGPGRSPCLKCANSELAETVIVTNGFFFDPVRWQIVTLDGTVTVTVEPVVVVTVVPVVVVSDPRTLLPLAMLATANPAAARTVTTTTLSDLCTFTPCVPFGPSCARNPIRKQGPYG